MIAKITKGSNFRGIVQYILDKDKLTTIIDSAGVRTTNSTAIIVSFEAQQQLNFRVSKPVGHISLDFSAQDKERLTDELMESIAHEYLQRMGITDTQYIIGRHFDKEHPHTHIAFNRIDNRGCTISDKNDRFRSAKICKELTLEYGLYYAKGKEQVKEHRLKEPDKTRYEIYRALRFVLPKVKSWKELEKQLEASDIVLSFKYKGQSNDVQGVSFSKNGYSFRGSKIDRAYSYSKISKLFERKPYQKYNYQFAPIDNSYFQVHQKSFLQNSLEFLESISRATFHEPFEENKTLFGKRKKKKRRKKQRGMNI